MTKVCVFGLTLLTYYGSVEGIYRCLITSCFYLLSSFPLSLPPPSFLPCSLSLPPLLYRATMTLM